MRHAALVLAFLCSHAAANEPGQDLQRDVAPIIRDSCQRCHDADTTTGLNLNGLKSDLSDPDAFRKWVKVYDQISSGQMPPASEPPLPPAQRDKLFAALKRDLTAANLVVQRRRGRVPARRLTRLEYDYTIRDLLQIDGEFGSTLPKESAAGSFDTVGSEQRVSAMHLESYVATADKANGTAVKLHRNPHRKHDFDLLNNEHLNSFHERDLQIGGNISRKLDDGVVVFRDVDYLLRSDLHGFRVKSSGSGFYRISIVAEAFQSESPVAMKVVVKDISGQTELVGAFDLMPGQTHSLQVKAFLTRTKVFYLSMAEERPPALILADIFDAGGAEKYEGQGVKVKSIRVEGPLTGGWPPKSTRDLLGDVELKVDAEGVYSLQDSNTPLADVENIIRQIATRAYRRPLSDGELQTLVNLAKPALAENEGLVAAINSPLQAVLSSPQFLLLTGKRGRLDDYSLASRLSYFLWKTLPDDELLRLAEQGKLSDSGILSKQVDRLLSDRRSQRFVDDFAGQWLRLDEINATTPDEKLYPEYDELLHWSIGQETGLYLNELIQKNLSVRLLIDSDFTFLNRRLAEHYGIDGVTGQQLRRVQIPPDSPRGGLVTQASLLKVTANGLVTSPVKRGAFVLADLLGRPLPPPPNDVGTIEPDTSGATNVRDELKRHRNEESCAKCHRLIDPPGFALECFDPIGGFRTHYRKRFEDILVFVPYENGLQVDSTGVTDDGRQFDNIQDFKNILLEQQEQLATHLISQLVVYSTGGEIEFADRDKVAAIMTKTREAGFPMRTIIHEVVQSELFRNR